MIEYQYEATPVDGPSTFQCACGKQQTCGLLKPCTNLLDETTSALVGTEGFKSMLELEDYLVNNGGVIVNVNNLTAYEIAEARNAGHLFLDVDGNGFAWRKDDDCGC